GPAPPADRPVQRPAGCRHWLPSPGGRRPARGRPIRPWAPGPRRCDGHRRGHVGRLRALRLQRPGRTGTAVAGRP
nr:hypothetical protein [Tanacetum cinerariifolium]